MAPLLGHLTNQHCSLCGRADIEDLFTVDEYLAMYNAAFEKTITSNDLDPDAKLPIVKEAAEPTMEDKARAAVGAVNEFQTYLVENRIWLDKDLCDRLLAFHRHLIEAFYEFTTYKRDDPLTRTEYHQAYRNAWEKVSGEVPKLREEIEHRFRELLGIAPAASTF